MSSNRTRLSMSAIHQFITGKETNVHLSRRLRKPVNTVILSLKVNRQNDAQTLLSNPVNVRPLILDFWVKVRQLS